MITDYYGCDKCCKLRNLFDEYICPFTKLCKYPEYDEVHKILQGDVQKDKYTLEVHLEMKTIFKNLDKFDFYNGIKRKRILSKMFCVAMLVIIKWYSNISIKSVNNDNLSLEILHSEEATELLNEMIVQNSIEKNRLPMIF